MVRCVLGGVIGRVWLLVLVVYFGEAGVGDEVDCAEL